jgi:hypothetical protein
MEKGLPVLLLMSQEDLLMGYHQLLFICACQMMQMFRSGQKPMGGGKEKLTEFLVWIIRLDLD